jgi:chromosome segregation protein
MKLLRLTLAGFKSFADKTTIEFADGMTVIVGPNGCGKSNISDAVRWVLGEQNVRNLRGQKAEDVIFAGSENRKPRNAASVTLVLDNSHHELPIDTAEVAIGRKVYRNGDSEFSINKRDCRLKDIQELLANTGLGKGSMAIIGQNRVDQVLSARPEERRVIFEEVAGISKFRMRKTDGLRKLERAAANTDRVLDLKALLEEQMEPLAKEAEKARKLADFKEKKKALEATASLLKLSSSRRMISRYENEQGALADSEVEWRTRLTRIEEEKKKLEEEAAQHQEKMSASAKAMAEKQTLAEKLRGDFRVKEEARHHAEEEIQRLVEEDEDEKDAIEEMHEDIASIREDMTSVQEELAACQKSATDLEKRKADTESQLMKSREAYAALVRESEKKIAEKERLLQEEKHKKEDRERLTDSMKKAADALADVERRIEETSGALDSLQKEEAAVQQRKKELETNGRRDAEEFKQASARQFQLLRSLNETESDWRNTKQRRADLERQDREHASFSRTTKTVLEAHESWSSHIIGPVGELIEVPEIYTDAAEVALGGAISHIVTDTSAAAQDIIFWLKGKHAGRTTFYPLDAMHPKFNKDIYVRASREPGIHGIAADLLPHDPRVNDLMEVLLGRVLIADNLDVARSTARKYGYRFRLVTLDGQVVNAGGSMTGGSMRKKENTYFGRKKEIENLYRQENELQKKLELTRKDKEKQDALCASLSEKITAEREEWQSCSVKAASLKAQREALEQNAVRQETEHKERKQAKVSAEKQLASTEERLAELVQQISQLADIPNPGEDKASEEIRKILDNISSELTECYVNRARLESELSKNQKELGDITKSIEDAAESRKKRAAALEKNRQQLKDTEKVLEELKEACSKAEFDFKQIEQGRVELDDQNNAFTMRRNELDKKWQAVQTQAAGVQGKAIEIKNRLANFRQEEQTELDRLMSMGLTEKSAEQLRQKGSMPEIQKRISLIDGQVAALGPVNPNGVAEYEAQQERLEFYNTQLKDLKDAEAGLQKIVREIDEAMTSQFRDAFAKINKEFGRVMQIMFQGGHAHLEMTDVEHPLDGGIEIFLQLPGKKTQSLTLMSGGERALTVSALLISFMAYRPAPFCFLDEIDAALDDANVERYSRMIRDYKDRTQFIIISHRKKTMEFADTLQGVTMGEKGVSSLITVHVEDYIKEDK